MSKRYRRYKNFLEKFLDSEFGRRFFNIVYSVGAAVVILGAMFKILHFPFGDEMLMLGMITEACVFLLSAFEKPAKEYKWEEVYPALSENSGFIPRAEREPAQQPNRPAVQYTSNPQQGSSGATESATVYPSVNQGNGVSTSFNAPTTSGFSGGGGGGQGGTVILGGGGSLGASINNAGTPVSGGTSVSGGTIVLDSSAMLGTSGTSADQLSQMVENVDKFTQVTDSLTKVSEILLKSFQIIVDNSEGIGNNTQGYIAQMEALNRNVSGLNTIYEIQLKGVSGQINTIEQINAGLDRMKRLYDGSLADSSIFKTETEKMAQQLAELNRVYARLLEAMTANMNVNPTAGNV